MYILKLIKELKNEKIGGWSYNPWGEDISKEIQEYYPIKHKNNPLVLLILVQKDQQSRMHDEWYEKSSPTYWGNHQKTKHFWRGLRWSLKKIW